MSKLLSIFTLIQLISLISLSNATISQGFQKYIQQKFGSDTLKSITRTDFGVGGSFGGDGHQAGKKTSKIPVVFVHGVSSSARSVWPIAQAFKLYGYTDAEVYGTTYGISVGGMPMQPALMCEYMKAVSLIGGSCVICLQVRALIKSVAGFTNSKVNVIGYSLGGPVSRKVTDLVINVTIEV